MPPRCARTPFRLPATHAQAGALSTASPCLRAVHRPHGIPSEAASQSCECWQQQRARDAPHLYAALAVHRHQACCFRVACRIAALRRKAQARDGSVMAHTRRAHIACHARTDAAAGRTLAQYMRCYCWEFLELATAPSCMQSVLCIQHGGVQVAECTVLFKAYSQS